MLYVRSKYTVSGTHNIYDPDRVGYCFASSTMKGEREFDRTESERQRRFLPT